MLLRQDNQCGAHCPARIHPDSLLLALACSFNEKDVDVYSDLLHDDFLFVFVPEVAESLGLPPDEQWWGIMEDVVATRAIFEDSTVTEIVFTYELIGGWFVW